MVPLLYIDTNVWIDHFRGRSDGLRPLGEFAFQLLRRALSCRFRIVVSSVLIEELVYNTFEESIKRMFPEFDALGKIVRVSAGNEDLKEAREICRARKTQFNDTLHAILARETGAEFFVTRNVKDFVKLQDLVKVALPENL